MKNTKKAFWAKVSLLFLTLALLPCVPESVLADGMVMWPDPYSGRWDYSDESNQQAFINHENGLQKMILSIGIEGENKNGAVWIFPIPADPNRISIDVFKKLPRLNGEDISGMAKSNLITIRDVIQSSQIYSIPIIVALKSMLSGASSDFGLPAGSLGSGISDGIESDVTVYQQLEKEGITSEVITAKTVNGLYDYLKNKGLKVESGSIPVLNNYIGKDYSFIVSWISAKQPPTAQFIKDNISTYYDNRYDNPKLKEFIRKLENNYWTSKSYEENMASPPFEEYLKSPQGENDLSVLTQAILQDPSMIENGNQKGVFVTFPTKDIYFPLLPTSVYGEKTVPADIRIFGHISPKIFENIKKYTKVGYYSWNYPSFEWDLEKFVGKSYARTEARHLGSTFTLAENLNYTKIEIDAPSKFLTDDLWMSNHVPIKTYYPSFISNHPVIAGVILLILSSVLAGILAGFIVFKDLRRKPLKLGLIGLSNCLTIAGLMAGTFIACTKNRDENVAPLLAEMKQRGYFRKRRTGGVLFFIALPFMVAGSIAIFSFAYNLLFENNLWRTEDFIILMSPAFLAAVFLLIIFLLKKIKPEDRYLFDQLKSAGYSSWSFHPKDKMKIAFVPLFSIVFLAVSWLLVKLTIFTV